MKWISIIIRDPTAALVAQPSHDARSTNRCSNAGLQESVYARWASCYRARSLEKIKLQPRKSRLLSHTNSLWGTTSFIERCQRSAENEKKWKMKTDKWKLSSGPFLFSVLLQFICEQFLLVPLWSCPVLYLLSFLVKSTTNPKHELNSLIKSVVMIRKRSNSPC